MNRSTETFQSDRISVFSTKEELKIEISGKIPSAQFAMLTAWLLLWTLAGIFVITQLGQAETNDQKTFMFVWLGFWLYFEYRVLKAWLWRKFGKELITVNSEKTILSVDVPFGARFEELPTKELRNLTNLEKDKGAFVRSFYTSFWVIGGEAIGIYFRGKLKVFGRQIATDDAAKLIRLLSKFMG